MKAFRSVLALKCGLSNRSMVYASYRSKTLSPSPSLSPPPIHYINRVIEFSLFILRLVYGLLVPSRGIIYSSDHFVISPSSHRPTMTLSGVLVRPLNFS